MIGQMAVRVTADRANFPLGTLFVRAGSAANVALMGVPVRAGVDVESITLRVENVDGATTDFAARQYGGVWVVDLPASHFTTVGSVANGVSVIATGTGADGETERTWNIGIGDLEVLPSEADAPAPTPGATFWPLRMYDTAPTAPTKYNAYIDGSALKIWNGTAWVTIQGGGSGSVSWDDVTGKPTAFPPSSHTHTQSEVNGLVAALAEKADAADLRYRIAEAGYATTGAKLPDGVTVMYDGAMLSDSDYALQFDGYVWSILIAGADTPNDVAWSADGEFDNRDPRVTFTQNGESVEPSLLVPRALADRTVNRITADGETSIDIELPAAVTVDGVRRARDFILDVDNSSNASDLALEFTKLGDDIGSADAYAFVTDAEDSIGEMTTVEKNTRVRLYFTETAYTKEDGDFVVPVFHVARVTLGDFVTTTTQGGN